MSKLDYILQKHKITEYLSSVGHEPVRHFGGKLSYLCPFPDHEEEFPSFVVWTNAEYENFHCFGCSRGYNIVHLISYYESIPFKDVLKRLSNGYQANLLSDSSFTIDSILKEYEKSQSNFSSDIDETILSISSLCRSYIESVESDPEEVKLMDKFWSVIDTYISNYEFDKIEETLKYLPNTLMKKRESFENKKLKRMRDNNVFI